MKCGLLNILLLTLLFYGECAAAPIQRSTHYTTADGLAHNSVQGFCIDSSGMLWICSRFALERFDGYRFESFRPEGQQEFSCFKTAYLSDDDQIFVTTTGGQTLTFSLKDYTFKNCQKAPLERAPKLPKIATTTVCPTGGSAAWDSTRRTLQMALQWPRTATPTWRII